MVEQYKRELPDYSFFLVENVQNNEFNHYYDGEMILIFEYIKNIKKMMIILNCYFRIW